MGILSYFANKQLLRKIEQLENDIEHEKTLRISESTKMHELIRSSLNTIAARERMREIRSRTTEQQPNSSEYKLGQSVVYNGDNTS